MFQPDDKMLCSPHLDQRSSYDSKASSSYTYDPASCDNEKDLPPPYGLVFCNRRHYLQNKPLPRLPTQSQRRVKFDQWEKSLPAL